MSEIYSYPDGPDGQFVRSGFTPKPTNNKVVRLTYIDDFILELTDILGNELNGEDYAFAQEVVYNAWAASDESGGIYAKDDHGSPSIHEPSNPPLVIGLVVLALTDAGYSVLVTAAIGPREPSIAVDPDPSA